MNDVVFAACAIAVAATVQALSGFGFGMVAMGLLPLVLPVAEAVPVVALLGLMVNCVILFAHRRALEPRTLWPVLLGALVGVPLGVTFLARSEPALLLDALGLVLVAFAARGLLERSPPSPSPRGGEASWRDAVGAAAGVAGGALGGAFNVGGPPLVAYVTWRGLGPAVVKATLQCCFLAGACLQVPLLVRNGLLTGRTLVTAGCAVPAVALGLTLGFLLSARISRTIFRRLVLLVLLALGLWFVAR